MAIETETFELPVHWATALMYGDESNLDESEVESIESFIDWMEEKYGACWLLNVDDESWFSRYHDASDFGVLACEVTNFTFDVTKSI